MNENKDTMQQYGDNRPFEQQAWTVGEDYILAIQTCDSGYDFTLYNSNYIEYDGGQLDNPELSMEEIRADILESFQLSNHDLTPIDYNLVMVRAELAEEQRVKEAKGETMKVLLVQPGLYAREAVIGNELEDMQKTVGGWIEAVYPYDDEVAIICNEEGLLMGLPLNRKITDDMIIAGTFFVCGTNEDSFISLSDEQMKKYEELLKMPEVFIRENGNIDAMQVSEEAWNYLMTIRTIKAMNKKQNGPER